MRKSQTFSKLLTSLFLILYLGTTPALAIEELLSEEETSVEVVQPLEVDISEDILDEGISDPEEIAQEEEIPVIEETVLPIWNSYGAFAETSESVELGVTYFAPQNAKVSVTFTKLPKESKPLRIVSISLTETEMEATGSISDVVYDITTDMADGTYEYDLTLPSTSEGDFEVVYAENRSELITGTEIVNEVITENGSTITIEDIDHFTIFVVINPNPVGNGVLSSDNCQTVGIAGDPICYDTLIAAVNAASAGDEIHIKAGVHLLTSQLVLNKDLTITGDGVSNTTIVPAFNTSNSGDARGLILVNNNANVDLSNLTIDGQGFNIYQAIRANGAGIFNVLNVNVKNIKHSQYRGFGIALMNTDGLIQNVSIENSERLGITVYYNSTYTIDNYTYTGKGNGDWLDYGIEVGGGGNINVQNSHFNNCSGVALSDGSISAGILATTYYGLGTVANIEHSVFNNNNLSIATGYNSSDSTIVTAHYNDFSGDDMAIDTTYPQVDATYNKWGTSKESEIQKKIYGDVLYNPWYGQTVTSSLTVDEYEDNGIYFVKGSNTLNFNISGEPVYGQHFITGLWGYNPATGSRDNVRYIGWQITNPNSLDVVNEDNAWNMTTTNWIGSSPPGTIIPEGDYLLWSERYYDEGGYVQRSTMRERVTIDNSKPTGQILTPTDGSRTNGTITISGWVADSLSGIDRVEVRLRNKPGNTFRTPWVEATVDSNGDYTVDFDTTTIPEDDYEVVVVAYDNVGNRKWLWRRPTITVDRTAPEAPAEMRILNHEGLDLFCDGFTNNRRITIDWADNTEEDFGHYILDLKDKDNHKTMTISEYNARIRNLDGYYKYKIRAVDEAGNTSTASKWCGVTLDRVSPTGTIEGIRYPGPDSTSFKTNDNTPVFYGTYADNNGVHEIEIEIGGHRTKLQPNNGEWESTEYFEALADGTYTLYIYIRDEATNETILTQEVIIDTVAPTAQYTQYRNGTLITEDIAYVKGVNELTFMGEYQDGLSGLSADSFVIFQAQDDGSFRFSANGKKAYCSWRKSPNLLTLTGNTFSTPSPVDFSLCEAYLEDGEYYMAHQVYDNAVRKDIPTINQFRDVLGLHFIVDTVAPVVEITYPLDGQYVKGFEELRATITDTNLSHYHIRITQVSSGNVMYTETTTSSEFTDKVLLSGDTTYFEDGEYTVRLAARDLAGNKDPILSVQDITVTLDNTSPELTIDPIDAYLNGEMTFSGEVSDATTGILGVEVTFYHDGNLTDPTSILCTATFNATNWELLANDGNPCNLDDGVYSMSVLATDNNANTSIAYSTGTFTVDNGIPTSPAIGSLAFIQGSSEQVIINLFDQYGLNRVCYQVGGTDTCEALGGVTTYNWDITTILNNLTTGTHSFLYQTYDMTGNLGDSVEIDNIVVEEVPEVLGARIFQAALGTGGGDVPPTEEPEVLGEEETVNEEESSEEVKGAETTPEEETTEDDKAPWWAYAIFALILLTIFFFLWKRNQEQEEY